MVGGLLLLPLFEPLKLRSITIPNRIAVSPMCQYSCVDGYATDWHLVHLGARAVGGAGLVIAEATAVDRVGRITPGDLGIYEDSHVEQLHRIAGFIKEHGSVPGIQIGHAGRKASSRAPWAGGAPLEAGEGAWTVVGPSAIPLSQKHPVPEALTVSAIADLIEAFRVGARRALAAGFEVIELHGAHGYLLHSFCSPLSNQRTDQYGGSFENRTRFLLEATAAVREVWPDELPLLVRLSVSDWMEGGWTPEDSVLVSTKLRALGVDLIDCSSGGISLQAKIPLGPGYQVHFAEQIRREAGIPTGAVGMITEPAQANAIIAEGKADLVLMGRELLREPYWPMRAAYDLAAPGAVAWPKQYLRAKL